MPRISAIAWLVLMEFVFLAMAYFGRLNPHPSGLLSSFFILFSVLFCGSVAGFLSKRCFVICMVLIWFVQITLTVFNWWYFQYFQTYFNYDALSLGWDALESYRAISEFDNKSAALILGLLSACFLFFIIKSYSLEFARRRASILLGAAWLVGAVISGFVLSVSFDRYRELNIFSLAPSYLSPIHAFFVSPEFSNESPSAESGYQQFKARNVSVGKDVGKNNYNVIVIVLESMRASLIGYYNGGRTLTPNFDRFARENLVATHFYANSNYTVKGETAILCGIFDHNSKPPLSKYSDSIKNLNCLPHILESEGYRSIYFHGNKAEFYSRDEYMRLVGFNELQFFDQSRREAIDIPEIGWGVADESMYEYMLFQLSEADLPFFASVTTLSSHYPFNWEWGVEFPELGIDLKENDMFANYVRATYYEDYAFGKFWEAFKQSPIYENTIVVVTADHGIWSFPNKSKLSLIEQNEQFFRMPLMIYHPDMTEHKVVAQIGSQIDIPPTILRMLGLDRRSDDFIGKDMLSNVDEPWMISMKSGEIMVRLKNIMCSTSAGECGGVHQECTAKNYGEILLNKVSDVQRCVEIDGDLLKNGSYSTVDDSQGLIAKALYIIRRQNKHVFGKEE